MKSDIKILYFASLGERLKCPEESFALATAPLNVGQLKHALAARGELWRHLVLDPSTRCAVNQALASDDVELVASDEVAFFPPVTGG